jgi:hypothetical protein
VWLGLQSVGKIGQDKSFIVGLTARIHSVDRLVSSKDFCSRALRLG